MEDIFGCDAMTKEPKRMHDRPLISRVHLLRMRLLDYRAFIPLNSPQTPFIPHSQVANGRETERGS